jgi:hypothetical protein
LEGLGEEVEWGGRGVSALLSLGHVAKVAGGFLSLPAFSSSSAVKRQAESPADSVESTEGETKCGLLVGVSNLTIKKKKWTR